MYFTYSFPLIFFFFSVRYLLFFRFFFEYSIHHFYRWNTARFLSLSYFRSLSIFVSLSSCCLLRSISKHQFLFTFLPKLHPPFLENCFFLFLSHFLPVLFIPFYNPLTNISTLKYFLSKQYLRRHLTFIFPPSYLHWF